MSAYEDKVEPRLRSALIPMALGMVGGLIVGGIPGIVLAVLSGFVLMPADVARYYKELHQAFLGLNDTIARVKDTPCWTAADLQEWRNFRDSWAKFYGTGPSTTWLVFSSDFDQARQFAEGLVAWRQKVMDQCGGKPAPEASTTSWFMWALLVVSAAGAAYVYFYPRRGVMNLSEIKQKKVKERIVYVVHWNHDWEFDTRSAARQWAQDKLGDPRLYRKVKRRCFIVG